MPKNEKTYQELQTALDEILLKLQSDSLGIEEAAKYYQMGLQLVGELEHRLKSAENTITRLREAGGE